MSRQITGERDKSAQSMNGSFRKYKDIFDAVITSYKEIQHSEPVTACAYDPQRPADTHKLSAKAIEYRVDIEHATEQALANEPELQRIWFALLAGDVSDPALERQVILRCGRMYASRSLEPWSYFKFKRGRRAA